MVKTSGKYIGSLFLFLAVLVLLSHAIIPHHHHNQQVCIESLNRNLHDKCDDFPEKNNHPHDKNDHRTCTLNQLVVIPNNQLKQECGCTTFSDKHINELFCLISKNAPVTVSFFEFKPIPAPESFLPTYLLASLSELRAPPAG